MQSVNQTATLGAAEGTATCAAITRKGELCRNRVLPGQQYCRLHSNATVLTVQAVAPDNQPGDEDNDPACMLALKERAVNAPEVDEDVYAVSHDGRAITELPTEPLTLTSEDDYQNGQEPAAEAGVFPPHPPAPTLTEQPARPQPLPTPGICLPDQLEQPVPGSPLQPGYAGATLGALATDLVRLLANHLAYATAPQSQQKIGGYIQQQVGNLCEPGFWRTLSQHVCHKLELQRAFVQRRWRGDYQTDPYGLDWDMIELMRPLLTFLYQKWWRITVEGVEHIPATGPALLVANHSGVLPWDGAMITAAVFFEHPRQRFVRSLFHDWFSTVPFIAPLFMSLGQVPGIPENATRLLEHDEVVCTFPEGLKGVGKPFCDRYQLARFGRGGFAQIALRTGAPIVPVAVVGAEEIYPLVSDGKGIARLLGWPYFPITPFFPWLGVLGTIPLPSRWSITFCPPIHSADYGPAAADNPLAVFALADQVRSTIQQTIQAKLAARTTVF